MDWVEIGDISAPVVFDIGSGIKDVDVGDSGLSCGAGFGLDAGTKGERISGVDICSSAGSGIVESSK